MFRKIVRSLSIVLIRQVGYNIRVKRKSSTKAFLQPSSYGPFYSEFVSGLPPDQLLLHLYWTLTNFSELNSAIVPYLWSEKAIFQMMYVYLGEGKIGNISVSVHNGNV